MNAITKRNRLVAKNRGKSWRTNLLISKSRHYINPTQLMQYRLKNKYSQSEMAKILDIKTNTYGPIERGLRLVSEARAKAIADKIKKPLSKVFVKSNKKKYEAK